MAAKAGSQLLGNPLQFTSTRSLGSSRKASFVVKAASAPPVKSGADRQLWFASKQSLSYLDGSLPGDYGFDGAVGAIAPEILGKAGHIPADTALPWFDTGVIPPAGTYNYWADPYTLFVFEMALMGGCYLHAPKCSVYTPLSSHTTSPLKSTSKCLVDTSSYPKYTSMLSLHSSSTQKPQFLLSCLHLLPHLLSVTFTSASTSTLFFSSSLCHLHLRLHLPPPSFSASTSASTSTSTTSVSRLHLHHLRLHLHPSLCSSPPLSPASTISASTSSILYPLPLLLSLPPPPPPPPPPSCSTSTSSILHLCVHLHHHHLHLHHAPLPPLLSLPPSSPPPPPSCSASTTSAYASIMLRLHLHHAPPPPSPSSFSTTSASTSIILRLYLHLHFHYSLPPPPFSTTIIGVSMTQYTSINKCIWSL